jgi:GT2 family glycosyltransferase
LLVQDRPSEQLIIVDASHDDATERVVRDHVNSNPTAVRVEYLRVRGPLAGLTRQRNVALREARVDLVAFFDDDMVLLPGCLAAMERAHRDSTGAVVGVAAWIENEHATPSALWRLRFWLGVVPTLRPGRYTRSGMSTPWAHLASTDDVVEGDWLPGGATMWRTEPARGVGFNEQFHGYAHGEDLEFSLLMRANGKVVVAGQARVLHLRADGGRPDSYQTGYFGLRNLYYIHRTCLADRTRRDAAYFWYAFGVDTLVRLAALIRPREVRARWQFVRGRLGFLGRLVGSGGEHV